jgi:hypothetical protein
MLVDIISAHLANIKNDVPYKWIEVLLSKKSMICLNFKTLENITIGSFLSQIGGIYCEIKPTCDECGTIKNLFDWLITLFHFIKADIEDGYFHPSSVSIMMRTLHHLLLKST